MRVEVVAKCFVPLTFMSALSQGAGCRCHVNAHKRSFSIEFKLCPGLRPELVDELREATGCPWLFEMGPPAGRSALLSASAMESA